eukprot:UN30754
MMGALARDTPQIYRLFSISDGYQLVLNEMKTYFNVTVDTTYENDLKGLITHFMDEIHGYVLCDENSVYQAITYTSGIPIEDHVIMIVFDDWIKAMLDTNSKKMVLDIRGYNWMDAYQLHNSSAYSNVAVFQDPGKQQFLAELSVFARSPYLQFAGDNGGPDTFTVYQNVLAENYPLNFAFGWASEDKFVAANSAKNFVTYASDYCLDTSELSNLPAHKNTQPINIPLSATHIKLPKIGYYRSNNDCKSQPKTHTLTFVMTDGDNLQWLHHGFTTDERWYGSANRGKIPFGWTISPALPLLSPVLHHYFMRTATANDEFIASPSGFGYAYPSDESADDLNSFAQTTIDYMKTSKFFNILNVIDFVYNQKRNLGPFLSPDGTDINALFYYTYGQYYSGGRGAAEWFDNVGKLIITGRVSFWGDINDPSKALGLGQEGMIKALTPLSKDPCSIDSYSLIPVHAWTHTYDDVIKLIDALG